MGVVVCTQGVQAQTVANFLLAFEAGLSILPVINKVRVLCSLILILNHGAVD